MEYRYRAWVATALFSVLQKKSPRNLHDHSLEATRSGLQETRRAIKALRASPLDDLGLIKAIQDMIETAAQRGRFLGNVSLPDHDLFLSPDVEQCIYRITQEAVENVIHHANARHLTVKLEVKEKDIELLIEDDGIGFNLETSLPAGHFGMAGMWERAQMKIIICDDQAIIRDGLELLLKLEPDIEVIGLAQDGVEAIELVAKLSPDLVLMDLKMPGMNGVEATRQICAQYSGVKVLVLTTFDDDE